MVLINFGHAGTYIVQLMTNICSGYHILLSYIINKSSNILLKNTESKFICRVCLIKYQPMCMNKWNWKQDRRGKRKKMPPWENDIKNRVVKTG